MRLGHGWGTTWGALLGTLLFGLGCSSSEDHDADVSFSGPIPPSYRFGGQTGSLLPDCGLAPLSAEGRSVPTGAALAVLYTRACPQPIRAHQLMLAGPGSAVRLRLVPLGMGDAFLVQADQPLAGGDYQLDIGTGAASEVRVSDGELGPPRLGTLSLVPEGAECSLDLQFELTLDDSALAYAPLSSFEVSIDGGPAQVWVDYGALPIESNAEGSHGLLDLPRCGATDCLDAGLHHLELTLRVAGESAQPEPLELMFTLECPAPTETAVEAPGASAAGGSCNIAAPAAAPGARRAAPPLFALFTALACFARRRHVRGPSGPLRRS